MATAKKFTSWSFSRYMDYVKCPLFAKLKHLDKIAEPGNDAMKRGSAIHKLAEDYIKGLLPRLPMELKLFEDEIKDMRAVYRKLPGTIYVEADWSFTKDWTPTTWNDWVGCFVRLKLDCAHTIDDTVMKVIDWKTGKFREEMNADYVEQLELYALAALVLHPHLTEVRPMLVYLDQGTVYPAEGGELVFTQADVPRLKKLWEKRVTPMFKDTRFAPKPNNKCRWCFYGQAGKLKGGPGLCKY